MPAVSQVSLPDFRLAVQQRQALTTLISRGNSAGVPERPDDSTIRSDRPKDDSLGLSKADERIEDDEDDDRPSRAEDLPTDFAAALNAALSSQAKPPVDSAFRKLQKPEISGVKGESASSGGALDEQAAAAAGRLREQQSALSTIGDQKTANSDSALTLKTAVSADAGKSPDTVVSSSDPRLAKNTAQSVGGLAKEDGIKGVQSEISSVSEAVSESSFAVSQQSPQNSFTTASQVTSADAGTGKTDVSQTKEEFVRNQNSSEDAQKAVSDRQSLPPTTPETVLSPDNSVDAGFYDITGVNDDQSAPDRDTVRSNAAGRADSPGSQLNETDRIKGAQTASDGRGNSDADIRKALSTVEIVRDAAGASSLSSDFGVKRNSSSQSVPTGFGLEQPSISVSNSLVTSPGEPEELAAAAMNSAGESVFADRMLNSRSGGVVQSVSGSDTTMNAGNSGAGVSVSQTFTESVAAESRLPMTSQVSRAVYELVQRQSGNENSSLTLRLDPPTLGELVIQLSKTEDGIAARVTASEPVTMDMLLARGAEIESQLKSQDLNFSGIEFLGPGAGGSDSGNSGRRNAFTEGSENGKRNRGNGSGAISGSVTNSGREQAPQRASGMSFRA